MGRLGLLSSTALFLTWAGAAHAQTAPPDPAASTTQPGAVSPTSEQGVISYPASYFAAQGPNTAWDMVDRLPGFTFDGGDQVRGFAGAAGNVVIDGQRPTSKGDDLQSILKRIPAAEVDHIEVVRGGAAGVDMHGKTIIANVVRKKTGGLHGAIALVNIKTENGPDLPQGRVEGSWQHGATRVEAGLLIARFVDDGSFSGPRYEYDANHKVVDFSPMQDKAEGYQNNFSGSVETPLAGGKIKLNLFLQDQPYEAHYHDQFVHAGEQFEHDHQDRTDGELGLHWERDLGHGLSLETIGLQHYTRNDFLSAFSQVGDAQLFTLNSVSSESIGRAVLHWTASDKLTVEGGGEYAINRLHSRTHFADNGQPISLPAANVRVQENRGEAFATATWKPAASLTVEAGVRLERSTLTSGGDVLLSKALTYPKPRLVLTWSPEANDQIRLRAEREVGQLDFGQFVASSQLNGSGVQAGNPNLVPQKDWVAEAAWEHRFWGKGAFTLTARHHKLEDVTDRKPVTDPGCSDVPGDPRFRLGCPTGGTPPSVFDEPANIGSGNETELLADFNVPLDRLLVPGGTLKGVSKWRNSRVTDPTTGQSRQISGLHQTAYELHFSQDLPLRKMNWGVDYNRGWSETYYRFNEIDTYQNHPWLTLWAEYKPEPGTGIRFMIDNASRRAFEVTRIVYAGPRNTHPIPQVIDFQEHKFGMEFYLRYRRSFG